MALRKGLAFNQEAFASALAADLSLKDAYLSAGYEASPKSAYRAAKRLIKRKEILDRVQELRDERASIKAEATKLAIERTAITMERVAVELGRIGFANMGDYMRVDQGGNPIVDFGNLTREQTAAIASLQITDKGIKFTLGDKRASLMDIAKLFGWIIEKRETKVVDEFELDERRADRGVARRTRGGSREDEASRRSGGAAAKRRHRALGPTTTAQGKPH